MEVPSPRAGRRRLRVGHVGFDLWVLDGEHWRRLNEQLIRSELGDSLDIRSYEFDASAPGRTQLLLQEVDVKGRSRYHGPFEVGESYGNKNLATNGSTGSRSAASTRRKEAAAAGRRRARIWPSRANPTLLLKIDTDGIHRVTYEQLAAAGLDLAGGDPDDIAVTHQGEPVAIRVEPAGRWPGRSSSWSRRPRHALHRDRRLSTRRSTVRRRCGWMSTPAAPGGVVETSLPRADAGRASAALQLRIADQRSLVRHRDPRLHHAELGRVRLHDRGSSSGAGDV